MSGFLQDCIEGLIEGGLIGQKLRLTEASRLLLLHMLRNNLCTQGCRSNLSCAAKISDGDNGQKCSALARPHCDLLCAASPSVGCWEAAAVWAGPGVPGGAQSVADSVQCH